MDSAYHHRRRWALALAAAILLAAPWLWFRALDLLFPFPGRGSSALPPWW